MAKVVLNSKGNAVVIVFKDGKTAASVPISPNEDANAIASKITVALSAASVTYMDAPNKLAELQAVINSASSSAAGIRKQLDDRAAKAAEQKEAAPAAKPEPEVKPVPVRAEPKKAEAKKPEPVREAPEPVRNPEPETPKQRSEAPKKPEKPKEVVITPVSKLSIKPRQAISSDWIQTQVSTAWKDDKKAQAAASALHSNSQFVDAFLSTGRREHGRTENERAASAVAFNSISAIGDFQRFLVSQNPPEYVRLRDYTAAHPEGLSAESPADVLRAADICVREFLLSVMIDNPAMKNYREEAEPLKDVKTMLRNFEGLRSYKPERGPPPSEADKRAVLVFYLGDALQAGTLTALSLFIRRWSQQHPERGKGKTQDGIPSWEAPQVIEAEKPHDPVLDSKRIGVIGDSITADGAYAGALQGILRRNSPSLVAEAHGKEGETTRLMAARFSSAILAKDPPYDAVIIQGGVNDLASGASAEAIRNNIASMVDAARKKGMEVIVLTITPWAAYYTSSPQAQRRTAELNSWILGLGGEGIHAVDLSSLGTGDPPALKPAYDRDKLHPSEAGKAEIARLIAEQVFQVEGAEVQAAAPPREKTALERYADANWTNLAADLYGAIKNGKTSKVVEIMRKELPDRSTIGDAITRLGRPDLWDASYKVFMDLRSDPVFKGFCEGKKGYGYVPKLELGPDTPVQVRRFVIRTMQEFLNSMASSTGEDWHKKLGEDLKMLYGDVLRTKATSIAVTSTPDMQLLAALSVYNWRNTHRTDAVGGWGSGIAGFKVPEGAKTEPAKTEEKKIKWTF